MVTLKKATNKKNSLKPTIINDSRFGKRKMYLNPSGKAKKGVQQAPGRGQRGESQN
jgi:hypothetical protein